VKALTLQTRVTILSAILIGGTLLVIGSGVSIFLYRQALRSLDQQLAAVADRVFAELEKEKVAPEPHGRTAEEIAELLPIGTPTYFLEVAGANGAILFRSASLKDQVVPAHPPGFSEARFGEDGVRLGTFTRGDMTLRLAADLDPIEAFSEDLATAFLVALPLVLLLVLLGSRWIARTALRPIELIASSAEQVTAHHLERRVPVPEARDSIHRLALVLNDAFDRLHMGFQQAMRFSADASHELKTPLTVLRASIEALLRSDSLAEADQEAVAGLLEQTKRISSITEGLLLLARADAGKLMLEGRSVDLRAVVKACADDAQIVGEPNRIKLELALPEVAQVQGDETRLMQIVSNLLDNAIKYNVPAGTVRATLEKEDNGWSLRIANSGSGIKPEHQTNVFDRFFRVEHFAKTAGYGLGLSLARELARAHGGDVSLIRSDSVWTEFCLTLPINRAQFSSPRAATREACGP
jgi:signal transduction histidine kinase